MIDASGRSASLRDAVFVRGLEFEGNHGYTAAERRGTRRFRVNLTLELPLAAAAASDRIADTVDYWKVSEVVGALGHKIQELYPRARVAIELEKLAPPCPGVPAACGVRLVLPPAEGRVEGP